MRRLTVLVLLVLVVAGIATAGRDNANTAGFQPYKDTDCWGCHATESTKIFEIGQLYGSATVGDRLELSIPVINVWNTDIVQLSPQLDISKAPSLSFASSLDPILGQETFGTIVYNGQPTAEQMGTVSLLVPPGATSMKLTMTPTNQVAPVPPTLTMAVYAATESTNSVPDFEQSASGPGESIVYEVNSGEELAELGYGTWTIAAKAYPISTSGGGDPGAVGSIDFVVEADFSFDVVGETTQVQSFEVKIPPTGSSEARWFLNVNQAPAVGETLAVKVDLRTYWGHESSENPDNGYFTKSTEAPVFADGGNTVIGAAEPEAIVVKNPGLGKATTGRISEVVGYASAFLVIASIWTGGMFGKASRRQMNTLFGGAKRRVAFHNVLSYGILFTSSIHMAIFLIPGLETRFHWTVGLIWGLLSILSMYGLGVTGALQVSMIRKWNYGTWRWMHWGMAMSVIVFTIVHMLLDGQNFGAVQDALGWSNPLEPAQVG